MTRSDLLTKLARRTNKNTTLDTATQNRLVDFLNERHRRLLSMPGANRLRRGVVTLTSTASRAHYSLPDAARIDRIVDTDNDRVLYEISADQYRHLDPTPQEGTPEAFVWHGTEPVFRQPSDASTIYVKSTSAADTTQVARIEGLTTEGYLVGEAVALTGTTAVAFTGYGYTRITKAYLSATCAGAVTWHEDSGTGTQLLYVPTGSTAMEATTFTLWRTPSAAVAYRIDMQRRNTDLAQSTDVPLLPEDFHDVLLLGALMDEYAYMDDSRYEQTAAEYRERLGQFQYYLAETASRLALPFEKPSRLGPWFASGV